MGENMTITALAAQRLSAQRRLIRARKMGYTAPFAPRHVQQPPQERRDHHNILLIELFGPGSS
jgi:hypothetical protein